MIAESSASDTSGMLYDQAIITHCSGETAARFALYSTGHVEQTMGYGLRATSAPPAELASIESLLLQSMTPYHRPPGFAHMVDSRPWRLLRQHTPDGREVIGRIGFQSMGASGNEQDSYFGHFLISRSIASTPAQEVARLIMAKGWRSLDAPLAELPHRLEPMRGPHDLFVQRRAHINRSLLHRFASAPPNSFSRADAEVIPQAWLERTPEDRQRLLRAVIASYSLAEGSRPLWLLARPIFASFLFYSLFTLLPLDRPKPAPRVSTFEATPARTQPGVYATCCLEATDILQRSDQAIVVDPKDDHSWPDSSVARILVESLAPEKCDASAWQSLHSRQTYLGDSTSRNTAEARGHAFELANSVMSGSVIGFKSGRQLEKTARLSLKLARLRRRALGKPRLRKSFSAAVRMLLANPSPESLARFQSSESYPAVLEYVDPITQRMVADASPSDPILQCVLRSSDTPVSLKLHVLFGSLEYLQSCNDQVRQQRVAAAWQRFGDIRLFVRFSKQWCKACRKDQVANRYAQLILGDIASR